MDVSNSWLTTLGFERDDVIGKTALQLGIAIDFDKSVRDQLIDKLKSGIPSHTFEGQLRSRSGEIRQYLVSAEIIELYGEDHLLLVSLDFTEQRDAERKVRELNEQLEQMVEDRTADLHAMQQRFQDIAESMSDWIWELDAEGRMTYLSENAFEFYGVAPEQVIGKTRVEMAEAKLWNIDIEAMRQHDIDLKEHKPFENRRIDMHLRSGERFVSDTFGKPYFDEDNNFLGYRCTSKDITKQVEAEERLVAALHNAEAASRTKSEFLANMSHELRTPLNAILGFSESLQHQIFGAMANENQTEYVSHIRDSGEHLLELINDILDVSTIEAGKLELIETDINLKEIVDNALRMVRMRADLGGVDLTNLISENDVVIRYDERRLKQIFVNLISNAVKFSDSGSSVQVDFEWESDGSLTVSVMDQGIGMDQRGIAKALEKFGQVHVEPGIENEGTGLGLPLVQGLVEAHGGILEIESRPQKGTTVAFSIAKERVAKG